MPILKDFQSFAMKGNVVDLAIGVIIGGAFGKIVTSFVGDVLMPLLGLLLGKINVSALNFSIGDATVKYGMFLQSIVDFLIVSFTIFLVIRQLHRLKKAPEATPAAPPADIQLLTEIRDLLKK